MIDLATKRAVQRFHVSSAAPPPQHTRDESVDSRQSLRSTDENVDHGPRNRKKPLKNPSQNLVASIVKTVMHGMEIILE